MTKLNIKAFTLASGIIWALFMLFIGWVAALGWGTGLVGPISTLYIGFAPTLVGGIIGAVWGFIDGAIAGLIFSLIYNAIAKKKK